MASPRVFHPLVGAVLLDFESLYAASSPTSRRLLEHACGLARQRVAAAQALEQAIAAYEAAPFFERGAAPLEQPLAELCPTDLVRALLALHPQLWACLPDIPAARVEALAQRWQKLDTATDPLPLQPALARRLSVGEPPREPAQLFEVLEIEIAAAVADHHPHYVEGLITRPEAIWNLLRAREDKSIWIHPTPAPAVDLGQLDALCDALLASSARAPVVLIRGAEGSGRTTLARLALQHLHGHEHFEGWGFNLDNYHGGLCETGEGPVLLALSHHCLSAYDASGDPEHAALLARSVLERPEDARLILRVDAATFGALVERLPALREAPLIELPAPDLRARAAALLCHLVSLDEWFGVDWGLAEAIVLAKQSADHDSLELVLACAAAALTERRGAKVYELACARANRQLPDTWEFSTGHAPAVHVRARALVADPSWRALTRGRCRRATKRLAREQPETFAWLEALAASLHLPH